ncbi:MAG TPA: helix-turn-helix domain-containing protein [Dehalococcoidia bacterium]|nr:helix-turn-helix domain-containing protein [Dehalococcoidia bacterium]
MIDIHGELYLDVHEAAASLGVKPETLYAYVSRGRLRSFRRGIGRNRLYRKAEIDALLTLQPSSPSAPPSPAPAPTAETPAAAEASEAEPPVPPDQGGFPRADRWATER